MKIHVCVLLRDSECYTIRAFDSPNLLQAYLIEYLQDNDVAIPCSNLPNLLELLHTELKLIVLYEIVDLNPE